MIETLGWTVGAILCAALFTVGVALNYRLYKLVRQHKTTVAAYRENGICERCDEPAAYPGARYCGAACTAKAEAGIAWRRPA